MGIISIEDTETRKLDMDLIRSALDSLDFGLSNAHKITVFALLLPEVFFIASLSIFFCRTSYDLFPSLEKEKVHNL